LPAVETNAESHDALVEKAIANRYRAPDHSAQNQLVARAALEKESA
jgi:hypothetical protein